MERARHRHRPRPAEAADAASEDLLRRVGQRVRDARRQRGESRAALAERSGLSLRFLAQLESGAANISLLRLQEVATALGSDLQALLVFEPASHHPDDGASQSRTRQPAARRGAVERLLRGRSARELEEVRQWLAARFELERRPVVALLGLRGAGKSSVGAQLARRLGVPFHELDALIETAAGLTLPQIFELQGEAYYRRLERQALARFLADTPAAVLATGGGLVTDRDTYALLRRSCTTVWLQADPKLHWSRVVRQGDRRPMRDNPAAMQELRALLAAREPLYAQADCAIDTSGRSVARLANDLAATLRRRGFPAKAAGTKMLLD